MVALLKEGFITANLVSGLCLFPLFPSWSYPEVRLFAAYGLGLTGGMLAFPGEGADGRPYVLA